MGDIAGLCEGIDGIDGVLLVERRSTQPGSIAGKLHTQNAIDTKVYRPGHTTVVYGIHQVRSYVGSGLGSEGCFGWGSFAARPFAP
jgi:hypothetical protein